MPNARNILILGESFYLENRNEEIDPIDWYDKGLSCLEETDLSYVDHEKIFEINKQPKDGRWKNKGCAIYNNLEIALQKSGFVPIHNMLDYCTIGNYYLRPAINGQSLKVHELDSKMAAQNLSDWIAKNPVKKIIFVSSKAYRDTRKYCTFNIPIIGTCHPACAWWNRNNGTYGLNKFINFIKNHSEVTENAQ